MNSVTQCSGKFNSNNNNNKFVKGSSKKQFIFLLKELDKKLLRQLLKLKLKTFWSHQTQFSVLSDLTQTLLQNDPYSSHWCMVVYINVPEQQNIFFSCMKRPSDDSSRRIFAVQFWMVLHTFKYFFLKLKFLSFFLFLFFFGFYNFQNF